MTYLPASLLPSPLAAGMQIPGRDREIKITDRVELAPVISLAVDIHFAAPSELSSLIDMPGQTC